MDSWWKLTVSDILNSSLINRNQNRITLGTKIYTPSLYTWIVRFCGIPKFLYVRVRVCLCSCVWYCRIICVCVSPLPRWLCSEARASEICCQRWILIRDHCHILLQHEHACAHTHKYTQNTSSIFTLTHLHFHMVKLLIHTATMCPPCWYFVAPVTGCAGHGCGSDYKAFCRTWESTRRSRGLHFYVVIMRFNHDFKDNRWILKWLGFPLISPIHIYRVHHFYLPITSWKWFFCFK